MSYRILLILVSVFVFVACEDEDDLNHLSVDFSSNNAFIKFQNINSLRIKNLTAEITIDSEIESGLIKVNGSSNLNEILEVSADSHELLFYGLSESNTSNLNFKVNPEDLERLIIQGNKKVSILSTPVMDYLEVVTEDASTLITKNLKVRDLKSRREGRSTMYLNSQLSGFNEKSMVFSDTDIDIFDDKYVFYYQDNEQYVTVALNIEYRDDSVVVSGSDTQPLRSYFVANTHVMSSQGESTLDALHFPTLNSISQSEGESESNVWVWDYMEVRGNDNAKTRYTGSPAISQYLNGAAAISRIRSL